MTKTCTKCGRDKHLDQFSKEARGLYGRKARCRECIRPIDAAAKRVKHAQKIELHPDEHLVTTGELLPTPPMVPGYLWVAHRRPVRGGEAVRWEMVRDVETESAKRERAAQWLFASSSGFG